MDDNVLNIKILKDIRKDIRISIDNNAPFSVNQLLKTIDALIKQVFCINDSINKLIESSDSNEISKAMNILIDELKNDKEPGSYYYGWQSNLSMVILDKSNKKLSSKECNDIAVGFLEYLISQKK